LLEPLDEDAFFHRPSKPWHQQLNCHSGTPYLFRSAKVREGARRLE
jgi:hypothetical protein